LLVVAFLGVAVLGSLAIGIGLALGTSNATALWLVLGLVAVVLMLVGLWFLLRRGRRADRNNTPQLANDEQIVSALLEDAGRVFSDAGNTIVGSYRASLLIGTVLGLVLVAGVGVLFVGIGRGTLQLAASGGVTSAVSLIAGLVMRPERQIRENSRATQRFRAAQGRCNSALILCLKSGVKAERRKCTDAAWTAFQRDLREA